MLQCLRVFPYLRVLSFNFHDICLLLSRIQPEIFVIRLHNGINNNQYANRRSKGETIIFKY